MKTHIEYDDFGSYEEYLYEDELYQADPARSSSETAVVLLSA